MDSIDYIIENPESISFEFSLPSPPIIPFSDMRVYKVYTQIEDLLHEGVLNIKQLKNLVGMLYGTEEDINVVEQILLNKKIDYNGINI